MIIKFEPLNNILSITPHKKQEQNVPDYQHGNKRHSVLLDVSQNLQINGLSTFFELTNVLNNTLQLIGALPSQ